MSDQKSPPSPSKPKRFANAEKFKKLRDVDGHALCRWCQKRVPKGRRAWCSQECIDEYLIRSDGKFARFKVYQRDHGVCAICGLDVSRIEIDLDVRRRINFGYYNECGLWPLADESIRAYRRALATAGFDLGKSLWEADHIKPVCEGGGECGLDNLRTLCVPCHKRVSADLAQKRAIDRRTQNSGPSLWEASHVPIS